MAVNLHISFDPYGSGQRLPKKIDESNSGVTYIGFAPQGSNDDDNVWKIYKQEIAGDITTFTFSNNFVKWSDRTILNYS